MQKRQAAVRSGGAAAAGTMPALLCALACAAFLTGCAASLNSGDGSTSDSSLSVSDAAFGGVSSATAAAGAETVAGGGIARAAPAAGGSPGDLSAAARAAEPFTAAGTPGSSAYKIGPLDVLDISVFKVPELTKTVQVAEGGSVNLPLLGEVPVAGRTAQEVERSLTASLGHKYLQNPQITVYVKEHNSQRVTIEGAAKKPGVYPVRGRTTLLQFIAMAEGLDQNADTTVVVFRMVDGKRAAARFDIADIRAGNAQDPVIQSGDTIVISNSALKEGFSNFLKMMPLASLFVLL